MEIASRQEVRYRRADLEDGDAILQLLRTATYRHIHADWHLPVDWLGLPSFYLAERIPGAELMGCLAAAAEPPPVAWVRLAALHEDPRAGDYLLGMLNKIVPILKADGLSRLAWLVVDGLPERWLAGAGFTVQNWICTYIKQGLEHEVTPAEEVYLRDARTRDLPDLAALEVAAFDPLWRHSVEGLRLALSQSGFFEVAETDVGLVGFCYGVRGSEVGTGHLVRITVHPDAQNVGVGSALMASALQHFGSLGIQQVSLNTQLDNHRSHRLYDKFGFERQGPRMPVWVRPL